MLVQTHLQVDLLFPKESPKMESQRPGTMINLEKYTSQLPTHCVNHRLRDAMVSQNSGFNSHTI